MKKRALIICKYFAPYNMVAAIRPTKLAKYLSRLEEWEVTVLCDSFNGTKKDNILETDKKDIKHIITIKEGTLTSSFRRFSGLLMKARDTILKSETTDKEMAAEKVSYQESVVEDRSALQEILMTMYSIHFIIEQHLIARDAIRMLKNKEKKFDLIFSTYNPLADIFIGMRCKKNWPASVWIQDFRDQIYSKNAQPKSYRKYAERLISLINKTADSISAVSEGVLKDIGADYKISTCITNGFDYEDINQAVPCTGITKNTFNLVYTGSIYENGCDLRPIFKALAHLSKKEIVQKDVKIFYAGNDFNKLVAQSDQYGWRDNLVNLGFLSREQAIWLQGQADILLIASRNSNSMQGVVTGKIYEYLMSGRPVIGTVCGNLTGSKLKEIIEQANVGVCAETEVNPEEQLVLESYLLERYQIFKHLKEENLMRNEEYIDQFFYGNIADRIVQIYNCIESALI